jgi:transcriptional regulator with XRE-family HTH domain
VKTVGTISDQLRRRRLSIGLSLAEAARRAGTSAATLSRYENGWTHFETYTLQKLAVALGCELSIELKPRTGVRRKRMDRAAVVDRLRRLFWDHALTEADLNDHSVWLMERVLEYGSLDDVRSLQNVIGRAKFLQSAGKAARVSPKTRNFWRRMLELEGMSCTKTYSRNTAWNS